MTLLLEAVPAIEAAVEPDAYDEAEPNEWDKYRDFGHSHFRNGSPTAEIPPNSESLRRRTIRELSNWR